MPLGGEGGQAGGWIPIPNAYFSWQATDRVWAGLGLNVPFGLKTEWESDWVGRFHGVTSEVKTINVNPSLAFKLNDQFSIGAGASWQHMSATFSSNVPYGGVAYAGALSSPGGSTAAALVLAQLGGPAGLALEGLSNIEGDTSSWGWNVGLMFHHEDKVRLGVSYRAAIEHDVEGDVTFENAPTITLPGPLAPIGTAINARFADGPVATTVKLPETFSVAGTIKVNDKVELLADYTYTGRKLHPRPHDLPAGRGQHPAHHHPPSVREHLARRPRRQHQDERPLDAAPRHGLRQIAGAERSWP